MKFLRKLTPIILLIAAVLIFFKPVWLEGKLPIPADTIVGLYHPWRDFYSQNYPSGIPFKNFLITDPVRQQIPWKSLAVDIFKKGELPLWNPYNFSGTPLLANFQSAVFYPLNILFFFLPFNFAWTVLIILQPLLMGLFLYLYLTNLHLKKIACFLGGLIWGFCGFSTAWLEWNTVLQTALWLPLILLSIDKVFILYINISYKRLVAWSAIFIFSLVSSFFAGHLQIFFYVLIFSFAYLCIKWWQNGKKYKTFLLFAICYLLFTIITAVQWIPTLQFINLSAREFDLPNWQSSSWFLPWQNLIQFFAPDFFGNPATLNYWGIWNYAEFVGYIGILPLILSFMALFWRRDKKTLFYGSMTIITLLFILPTPLAKLPYQWQIPLISTSQPTRLLFLVDFALAVLTALGMDYLLKRLGDPNLKNKMIKVVSTLGVILICLWVYTLFGKDWMGGVSLENLEVAKRNLILPSFILLISAITLFIYDILIYHIRVRKLILAVIIFIVIFDLFRFGWKYESFSDQKWLFPQTKTIEFLQKQPKPFRIMTTDRKILPPNFSSLYKIEDVSGYDPLYLKSYGELVAAWNRGKPDISPAAFNRILTPQDYSSPIADLLNVKYVLSLKDEVSPKLKLVFREGETRIYENKNVMPRAFFVKNIKWVKTKQEVIEAMFDKDFNPLKTAIIEKPDYLTADDNQELCQPGNVKIIEYEPNRIVLKVSCHWRNSNYGFLVLSNIFYPTWKVKVYSPNNHYYWDNHIYKTDYGLMGVFVPWEGENIVEFSHQLLPEFRYSGNL